MLVLISVSSPFNDDKKPLDMLVIPNNVRNLLVLLGKAPTYVVLDGVGAYFSWRVHATGI